MLNHSFLTLSLDFSAVLVTFYCISVYCKFAGCKGLTSIEIPESVIKIENSAFSSCSELASVSIPNSVVSIGDDAFYGPKKLSEIIIPNSVKTIGKQCFRYCTNLSSVTIGNSVVNIGDEAFAWCDIQNVKCYATNVPTTKANAFPDNLNNATLTVFEQSLDSYKATEPWNRFGSIKTMKPILVSDIALSKESMILEEETDSKLLVTVAPDNATNKSVNWSSSDDNIITVDAEGVVKAVSPGSAIINVTANDGSGKSASCVVTVISASAIDQINVDTPVVICYDISGLPLTIDKKGIYFRMKNGKSEKIFQK